MQRTWAEKQADMERRERLSQDCADSLAHERDLLRARLEEKEMAMGDQNALLDKLRRDNEELAGRSRAQIAELEETVRQQKQEARTSHAEVHDVQARMEKALKLLQNRTQELKGAQPFLTKTDSFSGADVIALVQSLNGEIFQLSAIMADSFPMVGDSPNVAEEQMLAPNNTEKYLGARLKAALLSTTHLKDPTVLQLAFQCYLTWSSMHIIRSWTFHDSFREIYALYGWVRHEGEDGLLLQLNYTNWLASI